MRKEKTTPYFAYGSLAHSDIMRMILGRRITVQPHITLLDHEICLQSWWELPYPVREQLEERGWDEGFREYCIRPASGRKVEGVLYDMLPLDLRVLGGWNMIEDGVWFRRSDVLIIRNGGTNVPALADIVEDPSLSAIEDPYSTLHSNSTYPKLFFPRLFYDVERLSAIATKYREELLEKLMRNPAPIL